MRRSLFNSEAPVWQLLGGFGELLLLSLMWVLCSVPVVTMGAATAALYDAVVHSVRNGEESIFSRYLRTLKNELFSAMPSTILWAGLIVGFFLLYRRYTDNAGTSQTAYIFAIALLAPQIAVLGTACWVFPILSRFTFGFAALNVASVKLAAASLLRTLALGFLTAASVWICVRYIVPVMILPALTALVWSYIIEPVFRKYMD